MTMRDELNTFLDGLKQQRDELKLQAHLASAELKKEWEKLEAQFGTLEQKVAQANREAGKTADNVAAAAKLAGEEIAKGYQRIRKLMKS
ncbi:MAG: hypothetical protein AB1810_12925 [Pseudomonadota bacterium]